MRTQNAATSRCQDPKGTRSRAVRGGGPTPPARDASRPREERRGQWARATRTGRTLARLTSTATTTAAATTTTTTTVNQLPPAPTPAPLTHLTASNVQGATNLLAGTELGHGAPERRVCHHEL